MSSRNRQTLEEKEKERRVNVDLIPNKKSVSKKNYVISLHLSVGKEPLFIYEYK